MNINKSDHKNHNGIQYYKIGLANLSDDEIIQTQNWRDFFDEHENIIQDFHIKIDPMLNIIMNGMRGEVWQYDFEIDNMNFWPNEFIIREL